MDAVNEVKKAAGSAFTLKNLLYILLSIGALMLAVDLVAAFIWSDARSFLFSPFSYLKEKFGKKTGN